AEARLLLELLTVLLVRATLFVFFQPADAEFGLTASRIDLEDFEIEHRARLECLSEVRTASGSGLSCGDETARRSSGYSKQPNQYAAWLCLDDFSFDGCVASNFLGRLGVVLGFRRRMQAHFFAS